MTPMTWPSRQQRRPVAGAVVALVLALAGSAALAQASGGTPGTAGSSGRAGSTTGPSATGPMGSNSAENASGGARLAAADKSFMTRAAGEGLFEVEVARLAAQKASDDSVKRFASMLMDQHNASNQELMTLASSKGVTLPTTMPADKKRIVDRLSKQSGAEFDKAFVQTVGIKDHQEDIRQFEKASRDARDPELKAWAAKTLPVLQQHLAEAQKLPGGSKSASSSGAGTSGASSASGYGSGGVSTSNR